MLSLSLAIAACTATFSLIDALILRALPVNDPHRLVYVLYGSPGDADELATFNYPLFERMREASRAQVQLFGMSHQSLREAVFADSGGQPEKIYAQWISGDAFPLLGVKPALGRLLTGSDDLKPGQHPVAVISYDFWTRRFGRDPSVLGRWLTLRDKQLQIVGVTAKGFTGTEPGFMTDVWAPNMMWSEEAISSPGWSWFRIWGRVQPGVTSGEARAVLQHRFIGLAKRSNQTTKLGHSKENSSLDASIARRWCRTSPTDSWSRRRCLGDCACLDREFGRRTRGSADS